MGRSSKATYAQLYDVASNQQGYFTTRQALLAGYTDNVHPYHIRNGDWRRVQRGIYRLTLFPSTPDPTLMIAWLWSQNRHGIPQGVFSHQTARAIRDGKINKEEPIHMMVPTLFRKKPGPLSLSLHHTELSSGDVEAVAGFSITTARRTEEDITGVAPPRKIKHRPTTTTPVNSSPSEPTGDWAAWS